MEELNNQNTQEPQEATSVGMFLKYTRLQQKKDLDTVSQTLCIRKIYLKAIEEDNYKELPPVPYGMGFVRSYASYLGLNAERIVQCYKEEAMPSKELHTKNVVKAHPIALRPNKKQMLIGLLLLGLLYGAWVSVHRYGQVEQIENGTPVATVEDTSDVSEDIVVLPEEDVIVKEENFAPVIVSDEDERVAVENEAKEEALPENADEQSEIKEKKDMTTAEQPADDARVVVRFKGPSWFQISDQNDKVYVSGIFGKGYEYRVPNLPKLIFSVGKYNNVDVYIDGKLVRIANARKQTRIDLDQYLKH